MRLTASQAEITGEISSITQTEITGEISSITPGEIQVRLIASQAEITGEINSITEAEITGEINSVTQTDQAVQWTQQGHRGRGRAKNSWRKRCGEQEWRKMKAAATDELGGTSGVWSVPLGANRLKSSNETSQNCTVCT